MAAAEALPFFLDSMKCLICLDYAEKAVETLCCGQIYCEKCIKDLLGKDCPSCRKPNLEAVISRTVQRMVSEIPTECPNKCGDKVIRGSYAHHVEICRLREYECVVEKCEFSGLFTHLIEHFGTKHPKEVYTGMKYFKARKVDCQIQTDVMKPTYYCPFQQGLVICGYTGISRDKLVDHIMKSHQKSYCCPFPARSGKCEYIADSGPEMLDHIQNTHSLAPRRSSKREGLKVTRTYHPPKEGHKIKTDLELRKFVTPGSRLQGGWMEEVQGEEEEEVLEYDGCTGHFKINHGW